MTQITLRLDIPTLQVEVTQADSIQELRELIKDAVHCHYPDEQNRPKLIRCFPLAHLATIN